MMTDLMIIMWWMCFIGGIHIGIMFFNVIIKSIRSSSSNLCILLSASLLVAQPSSAEFGGQDSAELLNIRTYSGLNNLRLGEITGTNNQIRDTTYQIRDSVQEIESDTGYIKSYLSSIKADSSTTNTKLAQVIDAINNQTITFDDINIVNSISGTNNMLSIINSKINTSNTHLTSIDTKLAGVENSTFETAANTLAANTLLASIDAELVTLNAAMSGGVTVDNAAVVAAIGTTNSLLTGIAAGNDIRNYTLDELKSLNTTAVAHLDYLRTIGNAIQYNTYISRTQGLDYLSKIEDVNTKLDDAATANEKPASIVYDSSGGSSEPVTVPDFGVTPSREVLVTESFQTLKPELDSLIGSRSKEALTWNFSELTGAPDIDIPISMSMFSIGDVAFSDYVITLSFDWYVPIRNSVHTMIVAFAGLFSVLRVHAEFKR